MNDFRRMTVLMLTTGHVDMRRLGCGLDYVQTVAAEGNRMHFAGALDFEITFDWHIADAHAYYRPDDHTISFNALTLYTETRARLRAMTLHELCHAAVDQLHGDEKHEHGGLWANEMIRIGCERDALPYMLTDGSDPIMPRLHFVPLAKLRRALRDPRYYRDVLRPSLLELHDLIDGESKPLIQVVPS